MSFENFKQEDNKVARSLDARAEKNNYITYAIRLLEIQIEMHENEIGKLKKRIEELSK